MVDLYVTLIISKRRSFNSVEPNLKEAVREALKEAGYDTNGNPLGE